MTDRLSWDLFIVVFFVTIVAYSFIIGRDNTFKVIIGTYISAITADAIGNIFGTYFTGSEFVSKVLNTALIANDAEAVMIVKVFLFILFVILFSIKKSFHVNTGSTRPGAFNMGVLLVLGLLTAAFVMSTLIVYASGLSFVNPEISEIINVDLEQIFSESRLVQIFSKYYDFWFAMPALVMVSSSFILQSNRD